MSFLVELKRRNVFKVGVAYAIGAWLLIQNTDIVAPLVDLPSSMLAFMVYLSLSTSHP
jgi:hypothetical protein